MWFILRLQKNIIMGAKVVNLKEIHAKCTGIDIGAREIYVSS